MTDNIDNTISSGNVFADLGIEHPDVANVKADLALAINRLIERKAVTQAEAAEILGINQPKVSALARGKLDGFSIERLLRFLTALGSDVGIVVRPTTASLDGGHVKVLTQLQCRT